MWKGSLGLKIGNSFQKNLDNISIIWIGAVLNKKSNCKMPFFLVTMTFLNNHKNLSFLSELMLLILSAAHRHQNSQ